MQAPIDWLLEGEPWVVYRTLRVLCGEPEDAPRVRQAHADLVAHPAIRALVEGLADWPGVIINAHRSASQPYHRLTFLVDLGLTLEDPGMAQIVERLRAVRSPEGPYALPMVISKAYSGTGEPFAGWALCDAPLEVSALARLGLGAEPDVLAARDHMLGLLRPNGWPCALTPLIKWRGPGRKDDPCPYATLAMLRAIYPYEALRDSEPARIGIETLLDLWAASRERHPYMFYMGTNFRQLKVPFVWYDLMHVLEVLTRFPSALGDPRLQEMLTLLRDKADAEGRYTPESVWTYYNGWDFAQKKAPSRWLTALAWDIQGRVAG